MKRISLWLLSLLAISCAYQSPIYRGYGTWQDPAWRGHPHRSATLDWSKHPGVICSIDGNRLAGGNYKMARLAPGRHRIGYADSPVEFGAHPQGTITLDVQADHRYEFHLRLCFWCHPRKHAVWIDDTTTGDLAGGQRPDWLAWFL